MSCSLSAGSRGRNAPSRGRFEAIFGEGQLPACVVETDSILLMRDILVGSDLPCCISNVQTQAELWRGAGKVREIDADTARPGWPVGLTRCGIWSPTLSQEYLIDQLREVSFEKYEEEIKRNLLAKA